MYAFVVDFANFILHGQVRYFLIFFFIVWLRWFVINIPALRYRPYTKRYRTTKSVVIPVVDEDPKVFKTVLSSINKQRPTQIIVVVNGPYNKELRNICTQYKAVEYHWTRKPGKRNAINLAMRFVKSNIVVLVDSDTVWEDGALTELMKPFANPRVGGVSTRQKISNPTENLRSRLSEWLEDIRSYGTMQAMSVTNKVGCLPGRTIAFRTDVLRSVMTEFMTETFLGFHKEVSDDRSLTNLTLKAGYQTVLQSTAVVYTEAPESWKKYFRQQLRWAEGSQYNNIKMAGWMLNNAKLMFFIYWLDTLMPFLLWGLFISYAVNYVFFPAHLDTDVPVNIHSVWMLLVVSVVGAYISYGIRQLPAINEHKSHLLYLPFYIIFLSFVMAPIRMIGFARLADDLGWGTRGGGYGGASASSNLEAQYA